MTCPFCGANINWDHGKCHRCKKHCGCSFSPTVNSDYCKFHRREIKRGTVPVRSGGRHMRPLPKSILPSAPTASALRDYMEPLLLAAINAGDPPKNDAQFQEFAAWYAKEKATHGCVYPFSVWKAGYAAGMEEQKDLQAQLDAGDDL